MTAPRFEIDIDTGGTFTDGYLTDGATSLWVKVDTTPHDLAQGVLACVDAAAARLELTRTDLLRRTSTVRLSTTVGTNTLINRSGPRVGLLLGEGIGHVTAELPPTLPLDANLVATVPDSGDEADTPAVVAAMRSLLERGARICVVALAGGPDLARRELSVRQMIATDYPRHYLGAVPIVPSHQVTFAPDPAVRVQTAVLNAYLHPVMSRFLYRVEDELRRSGYPHPMLVANADGGTSRVAKTTALRTWGSGPAGGVAGVVEMAARLGLSAAVGVDIGGTSSDISLVRAGDPEYEVRPDIEGMTVSLPVMGVESVGVGGGSIARVREGRVTVGPDSAGAYPGPACFGLGGEHATVTDAAAVLGLFDPGGLLGGRKRLDAEQALVAVTREVAEPLGVDGWEAARRILAQAATEIAAHIERHIARRGLRASDCALFATGGAGGLLADAIGRACGADGRYAFTLSPVFSAFGLSTLPVAHAYDLPTDGPADLDLVCGLVERARRDMRTEGVPTAGLEFTLEVELDGAGVERVALGGNGSAANGVPGAAASALGRYGGDRLARLRVAAAHGASSAAGGAGPAGLSAQAVGSAPAVGSASAVGSAPAVVSEPIAHSTRRVAWRSSPEPTPVLDWPTLAPGTRIDGPALLESSETTVAVPPGTRATIGAHGEVRFDDVD